MAWVDPDKKIVLRQYVHPEDTSQTAINDASRWTTLAGPSEANVDEPHLVTGPLGTFLLYRHTPNPDSPRETDWYIRRLEGSTLGQARKMPDVDLSVGEGNGYNSNYVNTGGSGRANLVQDQANGRLHFVRALPGAPQRWNHVQYMTSDDGIGWSTNALLPKPAWEIRDLGAYGIDRQRRAVERPRPLARRGHRRAGLRRHRRLVVAGPAVRLLVSVRRRAAAGDDAADAGRPGPRQP